MKRTISLILLTLSVGNISFGAATHAAGQVDQKSAAAAVTTKARGPLIKARRKGAANRTKAAAPCAIVIQTHADQKFAAAATVAATSPKILKRRVNQEKNTHGFKSHRTDARQNATASSARARTQHLSCVAAASPASASTTPIIIDWRVYTYVPDSTIMRSVEIPETASIAQAKELVRTRFPELNGQPFDLYAGEHAYYELDGTKSTNRIPVVENGILTELIDEDPETGIYALTLTQAQQIIAKNEAARRATDAELGTAMARVAIIPATANVASASTAIANLTITIPENPTTPTLRTTPAAPRAASTASNSGTVATDKAKMLLS